jgi:hypothetical protein
MTISPPPEPEAPAVDSVSGPVASEQAIEQVLA